MYPYFAKKFIPSGRSLGRACCASVALFLASVGMVYADSDISSSSTSSTSSSSSSSSSSSTGGFDDADSSSSGGSDSSSSSSSGGWLEEGVCETVNYVVDALGDSFLDGNIADGDCTRSENPEFLVDRFNLTLEPGQRIAISDNYFNGSVSLKLLDEEGNIVSEATGLGASIPPEHGKMLELFTSNASRTYTLEVSFVDTDLRSSYGLWFITSNANGENQTTDDSCASVDTFYYTGDIFSFIPRGCSQGSRGNEGYFYNNYTVELTEQSEVSFAVKADFDSYMYLKSDSGAVIAENGDGISMISNSTIPANDGTMLLPAGTYTVEVTSRDPYIWGNFSFKYTNHTPVQEPDSSSSGELSSSSSSNSSSSGWSSSSSSSSSSSGWSSSSSSSSSSSGESTAGGSSSSSSGSVGVPNQSGNKNCKLKNPKIDIPTREKLKKGHYHSDKKKKESKKSGHYNK